MKTPQDERNEAIAAADHALEHLNNAYSLLSSAGNWGMFDIFAGGLFTSLVKRSKLNEAEQELQAARDALDAFVRELRDVDASAGLHIDTGGFMSFADVFFDNAFLDMYIQGQIEESKAQVAHAIEQVEAIRAQLAGGAAPSDAPFDDGHSLGW